MNHSPTPAFMRTLRGGRLTKIAGITCRLAPLAVAVAGLFATGANAQVAMSTSNSNVVGGVGTVSGAGAGGSATVTTGTVSAVAIGDQGTASADRSIAIGARANVGAGATESIALGFNSSVAANANGGVAIGENASLNTVAIRGIAIGSNAKSSAKAGVALGASSEVSVGLGVALGAGSTATRSQVVGSGYGTTAGTFTAADNLAIANTTKGTNGEVSVGTANDTRRISNVSAGNLAGDAVNVAQLRAVANANLFAVNTAGTAVDFTSGASKTVTAINFGVDATNGGTGTTAITLNGVANGVIDANSKQAINGSQLFAANANINMVAAGAAAALGSTAAYNPVTGQWTAPSFQIGGTGPTYTNVAAALNAIPAPVAQLFTQTGTTIAQTSATPTATVFNVASGATNVTVTGVAPGAISGTSTDAINGSQLNTTLTTLATATGLTQTNGSFAAPSYTIGSGPAITNMSDAITALATRANAVVASPFTQTGGAVAFTSPTTVTSFTVAGNAGAPVAIDGVANGTTANQAVNFSQLGAVSTAANTALTNAATAQTGANQANTGVASMASALGGGASYNATTGVYIAPSYSVAGGTQTNVGDALSALNAAQTNAAAATAATTVFTAAGGNISVAPVVGAGSATATMDVGTRTLTGVNNGALNSTSTQAVNGSQLNATNLNVTTAQGTANNANTGLAGVASALGGGATYNAATGAFGPATFTTVNAAGVTVTSTTVAGALTNVSGAAAAAQTAAAGAQTTANTANTSANTALTNAATAQTAANTAQAGVNTLNNTVNNNQVANDNRMTNIEQSIGKDRQKAAAGTAQATAAMHAINSQPEAGTSQIGAGLGHHDGQSALAVGLNSTSETGRSGYSISVSVSRNAKPSIGAGARWKF